MHTTSLRPRTTDVIGTLSLVLGMVLSMLVFVASPAFAAELDTSSSPAQNGVCFETNKVELDQDAGETSETGQLSGDWGTANGQEDMGTVSVTVNPGWTLEICLKQSTEFQIFTVSCPASSTEACTGSLQTPGNGNGLSHFAWRNAQFTEPAPEPSAALACEEVEPDKFSISYTLDKDGSTDQFDLTGPSSATDLDAASTLTVIVVDAADGDYAITGTSATLSVDGDCEQLPEVDFCDPADKPGGVDIAAWHAANEFDGSTCFDYEVTQECGVLDVQLTENDTPYTYEFRWAEGTSVPEDFNGDGGFPASFSEDQGDGSLDITFYLVGPEGDYFASATEAGDFPNWWNRVGETTTVDTDCEDPEVPEPLVEVDRSAWADGEFECEDTTVEQTREVTTTTTTYHLVDGEVAVDEVLEDTVTETRTRKLKQDEVFACPGEPEPDLSTASFTTGTECVATLPALTYDTTINETDDDPVGEVTLTVTDANGVERASTTLSDSAAGALQLPEDLQGETVNVSWDFDGSTAQQTLATDCQDVLGIVEEPDPAPGVDQDLDPAPDVEPTKPALPAPVVMGEQLPNTGFGTGTTAIISFLLMAFGAALLLNNRRRGIVA